jgi:hypothetical protein
LIDAGQARRLGKRSAKKVPRCQPLVHREVGGKVYREISHVWTKLRSACVRSVAGEILATMYKNVKPAPFRDEKRHAGHVVLPVPGA